LHAVGVPSGHRALQLFNGTLLQQLPDARRSEQDLDGGRASTADLWHQALRDDTAEVERQKGADLSVPLRCEELEEPLDRLAGICRVQGPEDEVAGLGKLERRRRGLDVAHLTNQENVRRLPEAGSQPSLEVR